MTDASAAEIREREANHFAMCLLMPEKLVRKWVKEHPPLDYSEDDTLKALARDFQVSMTVAAIRLHQLGIVKL